ncbi:glia-derived nexin [Callorhinchus milii]|uniref:Glia-derived nexin-like protein n=1 Tax=Callorhinchus milii TaxID=7868 RepID=V9KHW2_CALMI|nr:glia-derived nexin [Callorhinchus milii]XP_007886577.1 glia-derived nexin [Callorhinchus milii]|eukprot:gi/632934803/ref/XP_007886566.1/ PREDICTED: glia-derived nexin [Callorhinchus milii]
MGKMGRFSILIIIGVVLQSDHCLMTEQVAELGSDLGLSVFKYIANSSEIKNIIISPHGIATVLGMLQLGASRKTKSQLIKALKYNSNGVHQSLKIMRESLTEKKNRDTVTIANGLFPHKKFSLERPFVTKNKNIFQAEVTSVDYGSSDQAASLINKWAMKQTGGMIENLVSSDDLSELTALVVVNAIFFKGLWKTKFVPENTHDEDFYTADGNVYQVPMMAQRSHFKFGLSVTPNDVRYYVLELPYQGPISMFIALPVESDTELWKIMTHINVQTIQNWQNTLRQRELNLIMPKFTAELETDLKEPLSALGITDMFNSARANFPRISASAPIYVSKMFQKAKIEVNEEGTKAAAATVSIIMLKSIGITTPFILNRPFLYFIRHNPTGAILFAGRVANPEAANA